MPTTRSGQNNLSERLKITKLQDIVDDVSSEKRKQVKKRVTYVKFFKELTVKKSRH